MGIIINENLKEMYELANDTIGLNVSYNKGNQIHDLISLSQVKVGNYFIIHYFTVYIYNFP